jgi:hypothetical protein
VNQPRLRHGIGDALISAEAFSALSPNYQQALIPAIILADTGSLKDSSTTTKSG